MSYRNYIKPAREVLKRFDIYEELYSEDNYSVSKASLKSNINLHYLLIIEKFASSPANFQRLNHLIESYENNLILIDSLSVESNSDSTLILSVPLPGHQDLDYFCLESSSKDSNFILILDLIHRLHSLEIPYLELSPSKLLQQGNEVYLMPFRITPNFEDFGDYAAPEILAGDSDYSNALSADVWTLGCIFADFFISLTPLFEAVTSYERILKMFEVLGIPEWRCVEKYLTWETYKGLKMLCTQNLRPIIFKEEKSLVFKMLDFNPKKRISSSELLYLFSQKVSTQNLDLESSNTDHPKIWLQSNDINNTLNITLHQIQGLSLSGSQENLSICVGFELFLNTQVHSISDNFNLSSKIQLNFTQRFGINSENFKEKYRHTPIIINIYKSIKCSARKSKEVLIGSAEIFIGLLFSNSSTSQNHNSVYGWYNIANGNYIIGQILLEINTENPFSGSFIENKTEMRIEENFDTKCDSIKDIKDDLAKLNSQLTKWGVESENNAKV